MTKSAEHTSRPIRMLDVIAKKRNGLELSREEIEYVVRGYTEGEIPDYQAAAWLMASLLRGLNDTETAALTGAMWRSGDTLDLSALPGKKVDKHSTGGVGDKTSITLVPIAAAGGLIVPMISGRGLGHTGGTLDKLESIPGFNTNLTTAHFRQVLEYCGCAMIGQTEKIAPADGKFYALRDVTATVGSPSLICASIMSKKLAEGIDALVLDVKTGSGAFMKKQEDAAYLAELMVDTGRRMGKKMAALITDMDQPLGRKVGNALEIEEAVDVLEGQGPDDLRHLCLELTGWMFFLGETSSTVAEGRELAEQLINSGRALEKFRQMISLQGGDPAFIDKKGHLPTAHHNQEVVSPNAGYVAAIDCEQVGVACVVLGGGRERKEDSVDHGVGLVLHRKISDPVAAGEPLCTIHYNSEARAARARELILASYRIADSPPAHKRPLIHSVIQSPNEAH